MEKYIYVPKFVEKGNLTFATTIISALQLRFWIKGLAKLKPTSGRKKHCLLRSLQSTMKPWKPLSCHLIKSNNWMTLISKFKRFKLTRYLNMRRNLEKLMREPKNILKRKFQHALGVRFAPQKKYQFIWKRYVWFIDSKNLYLNIPCWISYVHNCTYNGNEH